MSRKMLTGRVLAIVVVSLSMVGCPSGPERIDPPPVNPSSAGAKAIELHDANTDGKLSGEELDKCPGLKAALSRVDTSGTGEITADMIRLRIKAVQDTDLGRMSFSCQVKRNGRPLPGAEVKFVPEPFLGGKVPAAEGKSDRNGMAMINIPGVSPPGIAPGMYRVEITKPGVTIPAKYNTETIFGQEIANDADGIQEGVTFDLIF